MRQAMPRSEYTFSVGEGWTEAVYSLHEQTIAIKRIAAIRSNRYLSADDIRINDNLRELEIDDMKILAADVDRVLMPEYHITPPLEYDNWDRLRDVMLYVLENMDGDEKNIYGVDGLEDWSECMDVDNTFFIRDGFDCNDVKEYRVPQLSENVRRVVSYVSGRPFDSIGIDTPYSAFLWEYSDLKRLWQHLNNLIVDGEPIPENDIDNWSTVKDTVLSVFKAKRDKDRFLVPQGI